MTSKAALGHGGRRWRLSHPLSRTGGRVRGLRLLIVLTVLGAWLGPAGGPTAFAHSPDEFVGVDGGLLSAEDWRLYKRAFAAIGKGDWTTARRLGSQADERLPAKAITWLYLTQPGSPARFEEIAVLVESNADWPLRPTLLRRAEEAMSDRIPDQRVLAWFAAHPPVSGTGRVRLAEALMHSGQAGAGEALLRRAWVEGDFPVRREREIQRRHRKLLTRSDHEARLDRLLWDERRRAARRMLHHVSDGARALAIARLTLMERAGGVDNAIARVPAHLKDHPGLVFERLRWRRRKGFDERAKLLLLDPPETLVRPEAWWRERKIQARKSLTEGSVTEAYRLARDHGELSGASLAEAEWLAGWIALRFLGDSEVAHAHFARMYDAVRFRLSRARGAYWAARAAERGGGLERARIWYAKAAEHQTAFYGQLAALRLERSADLALAPDPLPSVSEIETFNRRELVRVVRLLAELGETERLRPFIMALAEQAGTPAEHFLAATLAGILGRSDLAIAAAKRSERAGVRIVAPSYPLIVPPAGAKLEPALLLALFRQESEFNPKAVSRSGARGLMQLLPRTAKRVASKLKIRYVKAKLTEDPSYNATLGSAHLADLIESYDGSYVLALAAYNAGPSRVKRWLKDFGDPRTAEVDVIDWIELIPIAETRNYVQRVLEALQVYRQRLSGEVVALKLGQDLRR